MPSPPNIYQNFPNIGNTVLGRDFNFFQKKVINWTSFGGGGDGYQPDMIITFPTQTVRFYNLTLADGYSAAGHTLEYSFNGQTLHGELGSGTQNVLLEFENRVVSKIWFRVQSGSTGPITVSVEAWGTR